ncbi:CBS domain-containing protein [Skermanella aerolata]|uniref:Histidine kinase n=1 Tax=Skermanella aerolata TaxID=393310 RepID=A0A512DRD8_9PROT|nr:CBS domain-containing protein [Skermanella aerolata]KJB92514.1 histidine kinase [Skermanella aerolata KACC 11604]GEO39058.1 histidine kinase [Skermanella aerolata]
MKIRMLLELKGKTVVKVRPDDTISKAAHLMKLHHAGCVVVSEDGKHVSGIVAVRDIVYALAERESRIRHLTTSEILDAPISSVMTRTVKTCGPDDSLRHVMEDMTKWHILHIPVIEQGELCGIVSVDDVVKHAVAEMDMEKGVLQDRAHLYQTLEDMR